MIAQLLFEFNPAFLGSTYKANLYDLTTRQIVNTYNKNSFSILGYDSTHICSKGFIYNGQACTEPSALSFHN